MEVCSPRRRRSLVPRAPFLCSPIFDTVLLPCLPPVSAQGSMEELAPLLTYYLYTENNMHGDEAQEVDVGASGTTPALTHDPTHPSTRAHTPHTHICTATDV